MTAKKRTGRTAARRVAVRTKANPAGEGNYHAGPYTLAGGMLPSAWGQYWNFWQMDLDPLPYPQSSIVEACVWAYIRAIAQLPGYHKRDTGDGGAENVDTSALSRLLRVPNGYQTPSDFLVHLIRSLLLDGNSYWIAQRNERYEVSALHWTNPRDCRVRQVAVEGQAFAEVFYEVGSNPLIDRPFGINNLIVPARDVLHIKLATPRHPLVGETWLQALALELQTRGAIQASQQAFSRNMSRPSGVLQTDATMTRAQADELRGRWDDQVRGLNAGGVPILTHGLKWQGISVTNEDAQIVEQLKLTDRAVAAVFGVPAILLGLSDTGTQKSAEAVMAEWLAAGLGWLINHIEVAIDAFVGINERPAGREWTEYDTSALLRSAFRDRIEGLVRGVQGSVYSPDEARAFVGLPRAPKGAGKEPRAQQQLVPLSAAGQMPPAAPATPPAAPPVESDEPDDELEDDTDKAAPELTVADWIAYLDPTREVAA